MSRGQHRVYLVHAGRRPGSPLIETAALLGPDPAGQVSVVVGDPLGEAGVDGLCALLGPTLEECRNAGARILRLVMSGAAGESSGAGSAARRLSDLSGLDVLATVGAAVVVPGGALFSPHLPERPGGWWHFSPGRAPRPLGPRLPIPDWGPALERISLDIAEDHVVEPVPAGLLVRPAGNGSERVDALSYAVPLDAQRPLVLVGAPDAPPVSPEVLADVFAALPGPLRETARLLPADGRDALATGQAVADLLGIEVQVSNGMPVILHREATARTNPSLRLVGPDGTAGLRPYVEAAACLPAVRGRRRVPRVEAWRRPADGFAPGEAPGSLVLDRHWQVAVTPTGLWVGRRGTEPPEISGRPVDPAVVTVDLGRPRRGLDDSLWPALDSLFCAMEPEARQRAIVYVHGVLGADGSGRLRRVAVQHGLALAPRARRGGPAERATGEGGASAPAHEMHELPRPRTDSTDTAAEPLSPPVAPRPSTSVVRGNRVGMMPAEPGTLSPRLLPPGAPDPDEEWNSERSRPFAPAQKTHSAPAIGARPPTESRQRSGAVPKQPESTGTAAATSAGAAGAPGGVPVRGEEQGVPLAAGRPSYRTDAPDTEPPPPLFWPSGIRRSERTDPQPDSGPTTLPAPDPGMVTLATARTVEEELLVPSAAPEQARAAQPVIAPAHATGDDDPEALEESALPFDDEEDPAEGADGTDGAHDREGADDAGRGRVRHTTHLPVLPSYRSDEADWHALRSRLGDLWDRHVSAVTRALTRAPGLRMRAFDQGLTEDLAAVHAYLTSVHDEELRASSEQGEAEAMALLRCLASGLRRLPSYRGSAVRAAVRTSGEPPVVGEELAEACPVSARTVDKSYPAPTGNHYLIWSASGRRVGPLLDDPTAPDEVLFSPGTRFRVLDLRERDGSWTALLRELPESAPPSTLDDQPGPADFAALDRLRTALELPATVDEGGWPARCTGPLGSLTP
ncbi:hypothetical protein ABT255_58605 [Streptomyces mirabilis]|uniref:hypothetical protein n=1 Tax=Streptomyces mirabilis TaxID=68239 RepID=UPI003316F241